MKTQIHAVRLLALSLGSAVGAHAAAVREAIFSPDTFGTRGAVASEASECSAIGRDIIVAGGNAVDAIVGTTFCVGVVGMYHSGIGGGGFVLVRDAEGRYEAVDFRETAPAAAAHEDMYGHDEQASIAGGLAVAVPGEVRGLEYLHKKYGVLKWRDIMQGAIRVARSGFKVSEDMVVKMNATIKDGKTYLLDDPIFAAEFAPKGKLLQKGEVMTRKNLANTLERIANEGSDAFYRGEIAENLVRFVQSRRGILTLADLENYAVAPRTVHNISYRGLDVYGMSSPTSGSVALQMLRVLEGFPASGWHGDRNLTVHRLAETQRFAFAYRASLGDPAFVERDMLAYEPALLSDKTVERIHNDMSDTRTKEPKEYFPSEGDVTAMPESHGTSHISTADKSGMAVSLTTTINLNFGAQLMEPHSGIILNDEMNDFSIPGIDNEFGFPPAPANFIRPGKRPLSSITPFIATFPNGTLYAVIGAAGGSRISTVTAQCLWHAVEHGMTMREALSVGRLHDQLLPNRLTLENLFPDLNATVAAMQAKGHEVAVVKPGLSSVQAIKRLEDGSFEAVGEPRQANSAGYSV